jgi:3-oxoacyl-[acyl-carrier protein] reductase
MNDLRGKIVLVTGGSKGLGAGIARQFAGYGANIAFTYSQDEDTAQGLITDIEREGSRCIAIKADASDFNKAHEVIDEVIKVFGDLHILVCNAGFSRGAVLWKLKESDWDDVVNISLKGAFNYIHAVSPHLIEQKYGKIVCIGSINGLRGRIGGASYNAAKSGLIGLVKTAAAELGGYNINVNLVAPGFIETPSQSHTPELIRDLVLKECAIKRLGTPDDIAPVVVFLCSDAARHVTGQIIKVDAGQYL